MSDYDAPPVKIVNPPRVVEADPAPEHKVTIHPFQGGWHGITYKRTQVSVSPDGSIVLDKHVRPEEVEDFVAALRAAVPVASEVKAQAGAAADVKAVQADPRLLAQRIAGQGLPGAPSMPALPARAPRPAFTAERLKAARAKREGGEQ